MLSLALSQNQVRYNFCFFIYYLDLCTPHLSYITLHYITLFIALPDIIFGLWQFKASWLARNSRTTWQVATPCGANNSRGSSVKSLSGLINQSECGIGLCSVWGEGKRTQNSAGALKLWNCMPHCMPMCVSQLMYVCMLCCCCCRTLQQHFRRKAVNLSNVCTLSPYRQTRQLPLPAPLSTLCRPPGETHSSRADTLDWRFLENALRTQAFSGGASILWEGQGNCLSFSVKFSKQCAIRAVMRFPQERESARRASSAFSAAFYERRKTRGKGNGWKRHKERVVGGRLLEKLTGKAI